MLRWWGLMVFGAMTLVMMAQSHGIGSGLMATVVTTMPMWLALWTRLGGERVPLTSWAGLAMGVAGAVLLAMEGDFSASLVGALAAFGAPCVGAWALRLAQARYAATVHGCQCTVAGGWALGLMLAAALEPLEGIFARNGYCLGGLDLLLVFGTLVALNACCGCCRTPAQHWLGAIPL